MATAKRRRLSAAESRQRILDAAERHLVADGPEALRLQELAQELGISHPAILHHFGSREELVREVVKRALSTLHGELIAAFAGGAGRPETLTPGAVLDRVARTLADHGQARLIAWLILSGREPPELEASLQLSRVGDAIHAFRRAHGKSRRKVERADTDFVVQLVAFALLGDAVFGARMRKLEGLPAHARASADFRARLGALLTAHLEV